MDVFTGLADPVRRSLLRTLATGPRRVVDLTAEHDISRPAISRHLRLLTEAGLIRAAEHGRERHYSLTGPGALLPLQELIDDLTPAPAGRWEHALDALDTEVRRTRRAHGTSDHHRQETA